MPSSPSELLGSWVDGEPSACLPIQDRGLSYGQGVFETMRVTDGSIVGLDRHLDRLLGSTQHLGFESPDRGLISREILSAAHGCFSGVLKFLITAGSTGRGYKTPATARPCRIMLLYEYIPAPKRYYDSGISLTVCQTRLSRQPMLAGLKHLNRLEQVLARQEWRDEFQEGLMLDQKGFVIEGTMTNVFAVRNDLLMTAPLDECGVQGIQRRRVLDMAEKQEIPTAIKALTLPELLDCQELFVCNSVIGLWPVTTVLQKHFDIGPVTKMLSSRINQGLHA